MTPAGPISQEFDHFVDASRPCGPHNIHASVAGNPGDLSMSSVRAFAVVVWGFMVAGTATAETVRLPNDPVVSPNGQQIAFAWRGDVWLVPIAGGAAKRLTFHAANDRQPRFSPDGERIAFVSDRTGSPQVFVMPVSGGEAKQITFHSMGSRLEGWYPTGDAVLTSGVRDHFWKNGGRFFKIAVDARTPEWPVFDDYGRDGQIAPDGKSLLFVREGEQWWRKGYTGSRAAQIWRYEFESKTFTTLRKETVESNTPIWKPDGSGFYFVTGQACSNLAEYAFADQSVKMLTDYADDSVLFPSLSADGKTLVFRRLFDLSVFQPESGEPPKAISIEVADDAATDPVLRRTLSQAAEVAFTSDGLEVAFLAGGDIWVMDTELREPRQVTSTPEHERELSFSPDDKQLLFVSSPQGQPDLWIATRRDPQRDWWQNDEFALQALTSDANREIAPQWSPAGDTIAFVKDQGDLWLMSDTGGQARKFLAGFDPPEYEFSPDGKWLAYSTMDPDFNSDVWIAPVDGSRPPVNVSRHPDNDVGPRWSPDGKLLAFTGRRSDVETDVYYLWLSEKDDDLSRRDRKLEAATDKIKKVRKPGGDGGEKPAKPADADRPADALKPDRGGPKLPEVTIDFDRIHERLQRISVPDSVESNLFWSFDGKKLAFAATVDGKRGTHTVEFPDAGTPKSLTSSIGSQARWVKQGNAILWLTGGVPSSVSAAGSSTSYGFTVYQTVDRRERYRAGFDACWRTMRDQWYNAKLGNRDWNAVRAKYRDVAAVCPDDDAFDDVVSLMLGELNGSHLGFTPTVGERRPDPAWTETTAHLGVRFEAGFAGPGLKIRDVLPDGPAEREQSRLGAGDVIESINGIAIGPATDLTLILNGRLDRDLRLAVSDPQGKRRTVTLRPMSYFEVSSKLYELWMQHNRDLVTKLSDGRLGYLHIQGMNFPSLLRFEQALYDVGYGKDGLVIDVRDNGGGSTADHLLTSLTQPVHAITLPRGGTTPGYPQDRKHFATWNKPIVVLCNQNSFSNAEIFCHAIKTLKRGQLVGVPTAGGVISTGGVTIMDLGFLRLPFRGWFVLGTGRDMELNGAVPDVILWPQPDEMPAGTDHQLERAVDVLRKDVAEAQRTPKPDLIYATDPRHRTP
jgi:tricorn protease